MGHDHLKRRLEAAVTCVRLPLSIDPGRLRRELDRIRAAGWRITGDAGSDPAEEMVAIGWSHAAALHLGIDPRVVFHSGGSRGGSGSLLEDVAAGRYQAVPMLQRLGLTYDEVQARRHGAEPYPAMRRWLNPNDGPPQDDVT